MLGSSKRRVQRGATARLVARFVSQGLQSRQALNPADQHVCVERAGTPYLVTVQVGDLTHRWVVCPRLPGDQVKDAADLQRVHALVRQRSIELASGLPMALGVEPRLQWVAFEHLAGRSLLELMVEGLRRGDAADAVKHLRQTARLLAAINRIRSADLGLRQPAPRNSDYSRSLDLCSADRAVRRWLPDDGQWLAAMAQANGSGFEARQGDRLMLVDCQPKNVLVSPRGQVRCIDIDYGTGNPALNLAQFLVALDRLALRHPQRARRRQLHACQAAFAQAYLETAEPWIGQDLAFFYPWLLMRLIRQHASQHPLLGWYIRRTYGRTLRQYLSGLTEGLGFAPGRDAVAA